MKTFRLSEEILDSKKILIAREIDLPFRKIKITKEDLESMKEGFEKNAVGRMLDIDYSHKEDPAKGHKAAGWIEEVMLEEIEVDKHEGEGKEKVIALMGIPAWTPSAAKAIEEKEYRYISPEFNFAFKNPETGKKFGTTVKSLSILNNAQIPFQPNEALSKSLSEGADEPTTKLKEEKMEKLKLYLAGQGIKLSEDSSEESIIAKLTEKFDERDATILKLTEDKNTAETKLKEVEDAKKIADEERHGKEIKTLCEQVVMEGKLPVAKADYEKKEGFFYKMAEASIDEATEYMKELPVVLPVTKKSSSNHPVEGKDDAKSLNAKLHELTKAKMKADPKLDYSTALNEARVELENTKLKEEGGE